MNDETRCCCCGGTASSSTRGDGELPSGKVEDGEPVAAAAAREALEETGWEGTDLRHLVILEASPGFSDPRHHVDWTTACDTSALPSTRTSRTTSEWISPERVPSLIAGGHIKAAHTIAALLTLRELRTAAALAASSQPPAS